MTTYTIKPLEWYPFESGWKFGQCVTAGEYYMTVRYTGDGIVRWNINLATRIKAEGISNTEEQAKQNCEKAWSEYLGKFLEVSDDRT